MRIEFALLGGLRVVIDGVDVTPRSPKGRALLASLAVRRNQVVAADRLVDELWPNLPADRGRRVLQVRVAEVRKRFGLVGASSLVESVPPGYRLNIAADILDIDRFEELVDQASSCAEHADVLGAATLLREALGLWRGEALADVQASVLLEAEAARLGEQKLAAIEDRIAAELTDGCHRRLVAELDALVAAHPLRERFWEQRVIALYRSGRQSEALRACAAIRRRLRDELGLAPGPSLRAVEAGVLAQSPDLDWSASTASSRRTIRDPFDENDSPTLRPDGRRRTGRAVAPAAPEVQYVKTRDGVNLAYQVVGDGPLDLIIVPGYVSELDNWWEAWSGRLVRRLAAFSRLIVFDKRGMGLSDRPGGVVIDDWVEDVRTVLDAVGAERPAVLGVSAGGAIAMLFAATYPERTGSLVLYATFARNLTDGTDYPCTRTRQQLEESIASIEATWGTGASLKRWCPSIGDDPDVCAQFGQYERRSASPGAASDYLRTLASIDVRAALPLIAAPTLVLHPAHERGIPIEIARFTAAHIGGAVLVELDTADHLIWFSEAIDTITDNIQDFVTGAVPVTESNRALSTIVVVQIADRSDRPGGPASDIVGRLVERYRGRMTDCPSAPMVARFDGPARAVRCAVAVVVELAAAGSPATAGVHSGECTIVGDTVTGHAVSVAARLAGPASDGEVLVSQTVRDLVVGSSIGFTAHGDHGLVDHGPPVRVFAVGRGESSVDAARLSQVG